MNKKGGSICKTLEKHSPKEEDRRSWKDDLAATLSLYLASQNEQLLLVYSEWRD